MSASVWLVTILFPDVEVQTQRLFRGVITLIAVAWAALAWSHGFGSFLALIEIPLAGSAAILSPFALRPTRDARDARRRLAGSGLDLGL